MGCDIHGIIEQRKPSGEWGACPAQVARPSRDYYLFARLGGVRNYSSVAPIAAKRGLPQDATHEAHMMNCLYVSETDGDGRASKERAEKWIAQGSSKWHKEGVFVTHPDWHSHSWCTANELAQVLHSPESGYFHDCYAILLTIMRFSESLGYEVRFVFWFDN